MPVKKARTRKAPRPDAAKGDKIYIPCPVDKNSPLYRFSRGLTHQWLGSGEFSRNDATDAVYRALIDAGTLGFIDVPAGLSAPAVRLVFHDHKR